MNGYDLSSSALALLSAGMLGIASGALPTGLAEAAALGIGVVASPRLAVGMWLTFTLGHVAAKLPWYWLGAHADRVVQGGRAARWIAKARALLAARPQYGMGLLFVSALLSVPPFHLSAIAAGLVQLRAMPFVGLCLLGRLLRFGALIGAPGLLRTLFGSGL